MFIHREWGTGWDSSTLDWHQLLGDRNQRLTMNSQNPAYSTRDFLILTLVPRLVGECP